MKTIKIRAIEDLTSPKGLPLARSGSVITILEDLGRAFIDAGQAEEIKNTRRVVDLKKMIEKSVGKAAPKPKTSKDKNK